MSWRTAHSLDQLLAEVNSAAPHRSKLSDGSIGDAAHAARTSDHNPWVTVGPLGIVRARDFTHDPDHGCNADQLAERIRLLGLRGHPALKAGAYVIRNRRIASATHGWVWRAYDGSNPHTKHVHVSVSLAAAGFDSVQPWGVMSDPAPLNPPKEPEMTPQQLAEAIANAPITVKYGKTSEPRQVPLQQVLADLEQTQDDNHKAIRAKLDQVLKRLEQLGAQVAPPPKP